MSLTRLVRGLTHRGAGASLKVAVCVVGSIVFSLPLHASPIDESIPTPETLAQLEQRASQAKQDSAPAPMN